MDDSDQDFSILCSRLLKRVKRKGDSGDEKKPALKVKDKNGEGSQIQSRSKTTCKRKREKKEALKGKEPIRTDEDINEVSGEGNEQQEKKVRAKDKVLSRMQRFKRASPPRLLHTEKEESTESTDNLVETRQEAESDELLAQKLQKQFDSKAESQAVVDVEGGGLFFCQLCYKDLSAMNHQLRTQHINRCLDKSENSASGDPPPVRPRVPECPICGRGFKSEKTRTAHLKRCSATMGVSPAELLQVLHRQAAESSNRVEDPQRQTGGSSDTSDSGMPKKKKARKRAPKMDEDTMMAMALSRSLLEEKIKRERDREDERQIQFLLSSSPPAVVSEPQKKSAPGKGRGKRRKDLAGPPPLLLIQDSRTAQIRIQERVSALLLCPRPSTPPTPTLQPSSLPTRLDSALWNKSALPGGGPASVCEFYTPELSTLIQPGVRSESLRSEGTPIKQPPTEASKAAPDPEHGVADLGMPGTQALRDLVDLAEEGMTLTQSRCTDKNPAVTEPHLSGFVPEPAEDKPQIPAVSVSRLCSDLSSMVNNPQLSDVQLQVDTGDVYFAHSFMLYTRCPLLANMVYDEGFGVQEEGLRQAQRLLLNDVSGEAVYTLLLYLYTASCPLTHTLLADVIQLSTRFGLSELQLQCEQHLENSENPKEEMKEPEAGRRLSLADTQFMALLRSMWEHEESDTEETGETRAQMEHGHGVSSGDQEIKEELVEEEELDEIYEFAATQRKKGADDDTNEEDEKENGVEKKENIDDVGAGTSPPGLAMKSQAQTPGSLEAEPETDLSLSRNPDAILDRSYSRLFSESWGEYTEPTPTQAQHRSTPVKCRPSSVSEVIDLSISPPPGSGEPDKLLFPVAGVSPGQTRETSDPNDEANDPKQTVDNGISAGSKYSRSKSLICNRSHVETSTSVPSSRKLLLPASPSNQSCSELIVLSDCSDDMDVDPPGPARSPPKNTYTFRKDHPEVRCSPNRPQNEAANHRPTDPEVSGDGGELNSSAEVSWLIPATPEPSMRPGSRQTGGNMRRTQLFPTSSSSSTSSSRTVHEPPIHRRSDVELRLSSTSSVDDAPEAPPAGQNSSNSRSSQTSRSSFTDQTLPNIAHEPCSSTPLHSNPLLKKLHALESPLLKEDELKNPSFRELASSTSFQPEKADQMETEEPPGAGGPETIQGEAGNSFCCFDEPPMAFDDSWGLGGALPEQPPCFSLQLDSSEDPASPEGHRRRSQDLLLNMCPPENQDESTPPDPGAPHNYSLPNADAWDSWVEEDDDDVDPALPLSERLGPAPLAKRVAQLKTPVACKKKNPALVVPITPMPGFSDMDTPELKNRLNRYGVRPLPKKQMVLKLKEIHHYTHQLMSSDSEEETSPKARPKSALPQPSLLCFKQPAAPPLTVSPRKLQFNEEEQQDGLPASQDSNTSSTAESERSNPELCESDSGGSDSEGITASQAAVREKDKLLAVRSFIVSDPLLYGQVLQYQPLSLTELKARLRAAGIMLGTAKLLDFLDSQCITFTTAKPGQSAPSRRKPRTTGRGRKRATKAAD